MEFYTAQAKEQINRYGGFSGNEFLLPEEHVFQDARMIRLFRNLQTRLSQESKLFPVTAETLMQSWKLGLASVIYNPRSEEIIAFSRLTPLVDSTNIETIGLP